MTACRKDTPLPHRLRLVSVNPTAGARLMPLRELEYRLAAIDRGLRGGEPDSATRTELRRQRTLITAILATRLSAPDQARRLEHRLRWLAPRIPLVPAPGLVARLLCRLQNGLTVATSQASVASPARV